MAQYRYEAEHQIDNFADALEILSPVVALRRIRELDTNSKLIRVMPFNVDHVGAIRGVLCSIHRRDKNFDPREAASSLLLQGAWSDAAFEAVMVILRDAAPIPDEDLLDACHDNWDPEKRHIFEAHGLDVITKQKPIAQLIDELISNPNSTGSQWKNLTRKEGLYYDLVEYHKGGYHRCDSVRLAKRCLEPNVANQAASLITCGKPSSQRRKIVAYMRKYIWDSEDGPRFVKRFCDIYESLDQKERETVICAIDTSCEKLCEMPRAIVRNFHRATTSETPSSASGQKAYGPEKQKQAVKKAKVVVRQHFRQYGTYSHIDDAGLDRLLKDLARACDQWDTDEHRLIPDSLLNAPINVAFDLNNAMIDYVQDKGCKHEGSWMSPRRV
ncbi:hypothetical protein PG996_003311 [Apiospora saccharicola]|uniref:Uncharacterized protein n=1 Tax=Apiospora saccharicola TaxID=335842 RepID=A0ABR1W0W6_9PEZI